MTFIQRLNQVDLTTLFVAAKPGVAHILDKFVNGLVLGIDKRAFVNARQERGAPVVRTLDGMSAWAHRNESRQILILRSQTVGQP